MAGSEKNPVHIRCLGIVDNNNFCHKCGKKVKTASCVQEIPTRKEFKDALIWVVDNWNK